MARKKKKDIKDDQDLHDKAIKRYSELLEHWSDHFETARDNIDFMLGESQWDDGRTYNPNKLKLTINKCPSEVDSIVNEMRASRPSINTDPVEGGDVEASEQLDGLIRNTEKCSDASSAYDVSALYQVAGSIGWLRVNLDYVEGTFEQEPSIEAVDDFTSVMIDDLSTALDGSDARDGFVTQNRMAIEDFERKFPDSVPVSMEAYASGWADSKTIRLAEYYYTEYKTETLYQVRTVDARTGEEEITTARQDAINHYKEMLEPELGPLEIIQKREEETKVIKWCLLSGAEILQKTEWIGRYIPLVPVYGKMFFNDGERKLISLIDVLRDPQRSLNYWESFNTETAALQPNAHWTMTQQQVQGYEDMWQNANQRAYPFLLYNHIIDPKTGQPVPPPTRQAPPELSPVLQQQTMVAMQHIKGVTGKVYDEGHKTLGSESGKAILAKERKSDVASFHFIDNQAKSIRMVGKILVDLYPKIYNKGKVKRILGEDGTAEEVELLDGLFDGKYDVHVNVGPSYSSQRQEFAESMIQLAAGVPEIMQVCGDIIIRNMDFAGAQEAADRLKKAMPAILTDDEQTPEQAALMQAQEAIKILEQQLVQLQEQLKDKTRSEDLKHQIDLMKVSIDARKVEIEAYKAQADSEGNIPAQAFNELLAFIQNLEQKVGDVGETVSMMMNEDEILAQMQNPGSPQNEEFPTMGLGDPEQPLE